jgi:hypothetical protein
MIKGSLEFGVDATFQAIWPVMLFRFRRRCYRVAIPLSLNSAQERAIDAPEVLPIRRGYFRIGRPTKCFSVCLEPHFFCTSPTRRLGSSIRLP